MRYVVDLNTFTQASQQVVLASRAEAERHNHQSAMPEHLTLALLRHQGITPHLHVYGRENDDDVRVAKASRLRHAGDYL